MMTDGELVGRVLQLVVQVVDAAAEMAMGCGQREVGGLLSEVALVVFVQMEEVGDVGLEKEGRERLGVALKEVGAEVVRLCVGLEERRLEEGG